MDTEFTPLEKTILKAKGLTDEQLSALAAVGVVSRDHLRTVGDAGTLLELVPEIDPAIAGKVMDWALGHSQAAAAAAAPGPVSSGNVVLEAADVVHCVHCGAR